MDVVGGHGSHVCGTIAGNSILGANNYNGLAYNAKLAFFDVNQGNSTSFLVPSIYYTVFPIAMKAGAFLHSNSWYE